MEGFAVTCPLAPDVPRLISGFCSSPRSFGLGFLQTPPHDDALALLLAFGSASLAVGLSPTKQRAMPGAHVVGDRRCAASSRSVRRAKRTGSTAGLGGAASFSRPSLIEVLDAIHDTLYALFLAPMPNAMLFSEATPRLNEEVFL